MTRHWALRTDQQRREFFRGTSYRRAGCARNGAIGLMLTVAFTPDG